MSNKPVTISLKAARRLVLRSHLLTGKPFERSCKATLKTIEDLGYVQIDTISVVERAHHHVLWTRQPDYEPSYLDRLLAHDRTIFEYWTHAASYVPMRDYRFYLSRMARNRDSDRVRVWAKQNRKVLDHVLTRIREEGPLASADFEDTRKRRGSWWDWKPAKRALEILFDSGDLMVRSRRKFQRIYDLTERVLPPDVNVKKPTEDESVRFQVRGALERFGLASERDLTHKQGGHRDRIVRCLQNLVEGREVLPLRVKGLDGHDFYAMREGFGVSARSRIRNQIHILSPFDNAVIRRDRLERFFDFAYRLECYYPEPKRKYGYFTLPILWGDRFVGRLDAKAERKSGVLIVRHLWFEEGFSDYDGVVDSIGKKLREFALFNGCDSIGLEAVTPRKVKKILKRALGLATK